MVSEVFKNLAVFVHLVSAEETIDVNQTRILLCTGSKFEINVPYSLYDAEELVKDANFTKSKTTLFIPDYYVAQYSNHHVLAPAYYKNGGYNYLQLDWGFSTDDPSKAKQPDEKALKPLLTDFILQLFKSINREDFNLVAYSTGAPFAASIAEEMISKTNGEMKLARLTFLDPVDSSKLGRNNNFADFTDAIHTSAYIRGTSESVADADFWPNGGVVQLGCTIAKDVNPEGCSHERSFELWAESVEQEITGPQFDAYNATTFREFMSLFMSNKLANPEAMGASCSPSARGNYFLFTDSQYPYTQDYTP